MFLKRTNST